MNNSNVQPAPVFTKKVEDLVPGDYVDLLSCPYLKNHHSAEFDYARVTEVALEAENGCVGVGYEGIDFFGYAMGTVLTVRDGSPLDIALAALTDIAAGGTAYSTSCPELVTKAASALRRCQAQIDAKAAVTH